MSFIASCSRKRVFHRETSSTMGGVAVLQSTLILLEEYANGARPARMSNRRGVGAHAWLSESKEARSVVRSHVPWPSAAA
jgi:hypothetical protein